MACPQPMSIMDFGLKPMSFRYTLTGWCSQAASRRAPVRIARHIALAGAGADCLGALEADQGNGPVGQAAGLEAERGDLGVGQVLVNCNSIQHGQSIQCYR